MEKAPQEGLTGGSALLLAGVLVLVVWFVVKVARKWRRDFKAAVALRASLESRAWAGAEARAVNHVVIANGVANARDLVDGSSPAALAGDDHDRAALDVDHERHVSTYDISSARDDHDNGTGSVVPPALGGGRVRPPLRADDAGAGAPVLHRARGGFVAPGSLMPGQQLPPGVRHGG